MTKEEKHLWYDFLKPFYQTYNIRFIRQKIIGDYIADFYCPKAKVVVELDGSQHYYDEAMNHDAERTKYLNNHGIIVLRYTNRELHNQFREVCIDIQNHVEERIKDLE